MNTQPLSKLDPDVYYGGGIFEHGGYRALRGYHFDENPEYHQDGQGLVRGMELLRDIVCGFEGNLYMVLTAQKINFSRSSLPSTAYDVFFQFEQLRCLDHVEFSVDIGDNIELPVAVLDLRDFDFKSHDSHHFGFLRDAYVFSDFNLESIAQRARAWISSYSNSKITSFDKKSMVLSLKEFDPIAFFNYSTSHNNWYEAVAVCGSTHYLDNTIMPRLNEALSTKKICRM